MCRIQKKRLLLRTLTAVIVFTAAVLVIPKTGKKGTELCKIGRYKNLQIPIFEQREISMEEAQNMMQSICEETETEPTEEMEQMIFQSMIQERIYETEMGKREAVLREIYQHSKISDAVDDPEEALLLAVYDQAGLALTEEEKIYGLKNLQEVFGAASVEELEKFLSPEEQLRIIKKEKTYEYLLKNNRFITVPSAPLS